MVTCRIWHQSLAFSKFDFNQWLIHQAFIIFEYYKNYLAMAKSQDARKETKKKPAKTLKEKRAEKQAKKASKN